MASDRSQGRLHLSLSIRMEKEGPKACKIITFKVTESKDSQETKGAKSMAGQSNAAREFTFEPAKEKEEIVHYNRPLIHSTVEKAGTFIAKLEQDGIITPAEAVEWKNNVEIDFSRE